MVEQLFILNVRQYDFRTRLCTRISFKVTYGKATVAYPLTALRTHTHSNTLKLICLVHVFTASKIECGIVVRATVFTLCAHIYYGNNVMLFSSNSIARCRVLLCIVRQRRTYKTWQTQSDIFRLNEMFTLKGIESVCRSQDIWTDTSPGPAIRQYKIKLLYLTYFVWQTNYCLPF